MREVRRPAWQVAMTAFILGLLVTMVVVLVVFGLAWVAVTIWWEVLIEWRRA